LLAMPKDRDCAAGARRPARARAGGGLPRSHAKVEITCVTKSAVKRTSAGESSRNSAGRYRVMVDRIRTDSIIRRDNSLRPPLRVRIDRLHKGHGSPGWRGLLRHAQPGGGTPASSVRRVVDHWRRERTSDKTSLPFRSMAYNFLGAKPSRFKLRPSASKPIR